MSWTNPFASANVDTYARTLALDAKSSADTAKTTADLAVLSLPVASSSSTITNVALTTTYQVVCSTDITTNVDTTILATADINLMTLTNQHQGVSYYILIEDDPSMEKRLTLHNAINDEHPISASHYSTKAFPPKQYHIVLYMKCDADEAVQVQQVELTAIAHFK